MNESNSPETSVTTETVTFLPTVPETSIAAETVTPLTTVPETAVAADAVTPLVTVPETKLNDGPSESGGLETTEKQIRIVPIPSMRCLLRPRRDATLKSLPLTIQQQIYEYRFGRTTDELLEWLSAAFSVKTNCSSLHRFFAWFPLARRLAQIRSQAEQTAEVRKKNPQLDQDADELVKASQIIFEQTAIEDHDLRAFIALKRIRFEELALKNAERRLDLKEKKAAAAEAEPETPRLTAEEYDKKMKEILDLS